MYNNYKIELKIKSSLETPIMGDTLFGHICWGIFYHQGEDAITKFLETYQKNPPLVISNGFPHNRLPIPLLNPTKPDSNISLDRLNKIKKIKKIKYIDSSYYFTEKIFSEKRVFDYLSNKIDSKEKKRDLKKITELKFHNTIDRMSNTTSKDGGGFYHTTETWYNSDNSIIDIYIVTTLDKDIVKKYFNWALESGYGANKSTGKGNIEVINVEKILFPTKGNRVISLGNFTPNKQIDNLRADIITKYGKLGGNYVYEKSNPFKKPLIMYREGASFDKKIDYLNYIGSLIENIHIDSKIKHHAYAPTLSFTEEIL